MLKLYGEELPIIDFEKRFSQCVAEFLIDGTPKIVQVGNIDGESVRCSIWNKEEFTWSSSKSIPYSHFTEVIPMLPAGWYQTPMGTFGLSYRHTRQWRHGYHHQRIHLWPEGSNMDTVMAMILTSRQAGIPDRAIDLHVVKGGREVKRPHVSGYDLQG